MIKVIFFDLGGVLFTNGTKQFINYLHVTHSLDKSSAESILDKGELPDAYREGKIDRDQFWGKVQETLRLPETIGSLEKKWVESYELIEGTKEIIINLSKRYQVYFLSDNVKDRVDALDKKYHFLSWFKGGIFSHEVGVRKPHPKIYTYALEKAKVEPSQSLFIDDKSSSLEPASKLGIHTLLFTSPEKLKEDLDDLYLDIH